MALDIGTHECRRLELGKLTHRLARWQLPSVFFHPKQVPACATIFLGLALQREL